MSAVDASHHGAVYDRGYRPYEGERGRRGAATFALFKASVRRALGIRRSWRQKVAPFVLLGVVTIPAIVNVGIGYITRDQPLFDRIEIITYRDYVGVSSALLLFVAIVAPDVMCPDRRQHVLPLMFARPMTGVDYVAGQGRGDRGDPVRLLVHPPGRPVRRQHARQRQRPRLPHRTPRHPLEGAGGGVPARPVLRRRRRGDRLADRPRIVAGASIIGLFLVTSIASGIIVGDEFEFEERVARRAAQPLRPAAVPARPRVPRRDRTTVRRSPASTTAGCWPSSRTSAVVIVGIAVLLRRYRWVER